MVETSKISNPFKPGAGTLPLHFASRDAILERIVAEANPLYSKPKPLAPRGDIVLHGPQGSGKTALLRKIEIALTERTKDSDFVVMRWTPAIELQSPRKVIDAVISKGIWSGLSKVRRIKLFDVRVDLDSERPNLRSALNHGLKKGPFVVLIDDAQELKPRVTSVLLNVGEQLRVEDQPFLMILAGTDELLATLDKVDETFCERSMLMSLEPLSKDDAKGALEDLKGFVESDAWPVLLDDERHDLYPHYVQEIGAEAIRRLNEHEAEDGRTPEITKSIAKEIVESLDEVKDSRLHEVRQASAKYTDRREQIERLKSGKAKFKKSARERKRRLADAQSEIGELKSSNGRLVDTVMEKREELTDMRSRNAKLKDAAEERDRQLDAMQSVNDGLRFRNAKLEEAARDRDQQLDALWLITEDLRSRNAKLEDTARKNRLQLADMQFQNDELKLGNCELERITRERDQQLADMKSKNAKLEDAARELEDAARESDRQLAETKPKYDKIKGRLNQVKEQHPMKWRWLFGAETPDAIEGE